MRSLLLDTIMQWLFRMSYRCNVCGRPRYTFVGCQLHHIMLCAAHIAELRGHGHAKTWTVTPDLVSASIGTSMKDVKEEDGENPGRWRNVRTRDSRMAQHQTIKKLWTSRDGVSLHSVLRAGKLKEAAASTAAASTAAASTAASTPPKPSKRGDVVPLTTAQINALHAQIDLVADEPAEKKEEKEQPCPRLPGMASAARQLPDMPSMDEDGLVHLGRRGEAAHDDLTPDERRKKMLAQTLYQNETRRDRPGHRLGFRCGERGGKKSWWHELKAQAQRRGTLSEFYHRYGPKAYKWEDGRPDGLSDGRDEEAPPAEKRRRLVSSGEVRPAPSHCTRYLLGFGLPLFCSFCVWRHAVGLLLRVHVCILHGTSASALRGVSASAGDGCNLEMLARKRRVLVARRRRALAWKARHLVARAVARAGSSAEEKALKRVLTAASPLLATVAWASRRAMARTRKGNIAVARASRRSLRPFHKHAF